MTVKILGTSCARCKTLEQKITALKESHKLDIQIEKVTQLEDIMHYGVMMTPGLVINGKVMSSGRVPSDQEILNWIEGK
jgi:small redox-active disulfide protein 2